LKNTAFFLPCRSDHRSPPPAIERQATFAAVPALPIVTRQQLWSPIFGRRSVGIDHFDLRRPVNQKSRREAAVSSRLETLFGHPCWRDGFMNNLRPSRTCLVWAFFLAALTTSVETASAGLTAYVTTYSNEFGTLDLETGVYTRIGTDHTDNPIIGMGFGTDGLLYGLDNTFDNSHLWQINPTTGQITDLGGTGFWAVGAGGDSQGKLIALERYSNPTIAAFTPPSKTDTSIGSVSFDGDGLVAPDSTGNIYLSEFGFFGDTLHKFDTATGQSTEIGLMQDEYIVTGSFNQGTLYGISFDNEIFTINTTTGASTFITSTSIDVEDGFGSLVFQPTQAVPEPSTLAMTAAAALALFAGRAARGRKAHRAQAA
jgi:hypothetical protein